MSIIAEWYDGDDWQAFRTVGQDAIEVETGLTEVQLAPVARIRTDAETPVGAGDQIRLKDPDGDVFFDEAVARSSGTYDRDGKRTIEVRHRAWTLFEDKISYDAVEQSTDDHLDEMLSEADIGGEFTIDFNGTSDTFEYGPSDQDVSTVLRDILDENEQVAYVEMASRTIVVDDRGAGSTWRSLETGQENDNPRLESWETGDIEQVVNAVTVRPTGGIGFFDEATADDQDSIDEYGRRAETVNIIGIVPESVAQNYAEALLNPEPSGEGTIQVSGGSDFYTDLPNDTVEVTDDPRDLSNAELLIEKQTIRPGRVVLKAGEGTGTLLSRANRKRQTTKETTQAGSVMTTERLAEGAVEDATLADDAVTSAKIQNSAVIADKIDDLAVREEKLADLSVSSGKLIDGAVLEDKLDDLSVSLEKVQDDAIDTVKITDDAIETPKIASEAVTASEILADTITASEIASRTITAEEIESDTVTANEIESETITASEIAAGTIDTTRLFVEDWIPVGLELESDDPNDGEISWNSHELVYDGETYDISSGSTRQPYVTWFEGDESYTAGASKPDLGDGDALIAVNDNGSAERIIKATLIHGDSIVTGSISAAEIEAGSITADEIEGKTITADEIAADTLTADEVDTLELSTGEIDIGTVDSDAGIIFGVDDITIGTDTYDVAVIEPETDVTASSQVGRSDNAFGLGYIDQLETVDVRPINGDDTGSVGSSSQAFTEMYAYDFIDADNGSTLSDGGNPLDGLGEGRGPPDHAARRDDDDNVIGYSLSAMSRSVWEVVREQQRVIDDLEGRLEKLEQRLSDSGGN